MEDALKQVSPDNADAIKLYKDSIKSLDDGIAQIKA